MMQNTQLVKQSSSEQMSQALAQVERQGQLLSPERIEAAIANKNMIKTAIAKVLVPGEDYGTVPGCGDEPILLKPGIERIMSLLNVYPDPEVQVTELANGHVEFRVKTVVRQYGSDNVVAIGYGSCSTMEKKYRYRLSQYQCPDCEEESLVKTKRNQWWCSPSRGGCNANFDLDDPRLSEQERGYVENQDISDARNTVLKMALKRSKKDAVDNLTGGWSAAIRHLPKGSAPQASAGTAAAKSNARPAPAASGGKTKSAAILDSVAKWPAEKQQRFDELVMTARQAGADEESALVQAIDQIRKESDR